MKDYLKTYFFDIVFKNYFNAAGRATRKEFWLFTLNAFILVSFFTVVSILCFLFLFSSIKRQIADPTSMGSFSMIQLRISYIITFLAVIIPFLLAFPYLNLVVRRLHDLDFSSWWLFLYLIPQIGTIVILVFMCLQEKKRKNRYDVEPGTKKFGFASLIMILLTLAVVALFLFVGIYMHNMIEKKVELIIDQIAQAELKYFKQNNDFLYVDKTNNNDILNINMQNSMFYSEFSCTTVTGMKNAFTLDDKSSKQIEIRVWEKSDRNDNKWGKEKYLYVIMNDKGIKTEADKKITYKKMKEMIEGK